jgi:hypothetical protein
MSHDLPDDWYEEHDGQRLVLSSEKVAAGVAAAVAAERERCAKIAARWKSSLRPGTEARLLGHQEAAKEIAKVIRSSGVGQ